MGKHTNINKDIRSSNKTSKNNKFVQLTQQDIDKLRVPVYQYLIK